MVFFHFDDIGDVCVSRRAVTLLPKLATTGAAVCGDPLLIIDRNFLGVRREPLQLLNGSSFIFVCSLRATIGISVHAC